jgi:hypothetical protein
LAVGKRQLAIDTWNLKITDNIYYNHVYCDLLIKDFKFEMSKINTMIQRKQSLYLLLTTALSVLFLATPIIRFADNSGVSYILGFKGLQNITGTENIDLIGKYLPLTLLLVITPVTSASVIFLYRNRKVQMKVTGLLIILILTMIALLAYYSLNISHTYNISIEPGLKMILPVLSLIFTFLAFRGIKKDEELVRSYDRLR